MLPSTRGRVEGWAGVIMWLVPWILDLDGALLDSEPWHKRSERETFAELGIDIDEEELHRFTGTTMDSMVAILAEERKPGLTLSRFLDLHRARLIGYLRDEMRLHDDVTSFLARAERPIGLATNSMRWYVDVALERFFPTAGFQAVVCVDEVEHGKPMPDCFLRAAGLMAVSPSACTALEDSVAGVRAAKGAGCYVIAVQRDMAIDLSEADRVVSSLDEL